MSEKRRKRHSPEQIVRKLRDADAMLNAGKDLAEVLKALEISETSLDRWRRKYGGMKSEDYDCVDKGLKKLGLAKSLPSKSGSERLRFSVPAAMTVRVGEDRW